MPESGANIRIAALTVLDRLVVALHRAGAGPIILAGNVPRHAIQRATALGIAVETSPALPPLPSPALLAQGNVLVTAADVRACLRHSARLIDETGAELPVGFTLAPGAEISSALKSAPTVRATGPACVVADAAMAKAAEASLWASLTSSSDGLVDRWFNRPVGRQLLSKALIHTPVTPNAISIASVLIGLAAAWLFAQGDRSSVLIAAILFQVSAVVDCVDGDIARMMFRESPLGKWIDLVGDQVVHIAVFAGIALGVHRAQSAPEMLWLGLSAVLGAALSFAVVLRGMTASGKSNGPLQRLIDAATNRDFSVIVLLLAAVGRVDWFVWLAAIGSHAFWIAALLLQLRTTPREAAR